MTLQEINQNIAANLDRICQEKGMDKAEFIKDLITHFSDMNYPNVSKETIYQMVNGGRKRNERKDLSPVSFGIEKLHAVSEYLGISIDGFISNDKPLTNDPEIQAICEYTGLYESSIKKFHQEYKSKIKFYTTGRFANEEDLKETNIQFNNIILDLLFDINTLITNYKTNSQVEKNTISSFNSSIKDMIDDLKKNKHNSEWFFDHVDDIYDIRENIRDVIKDRRCSLLDLQELILGYAKRNANTAEIQHIEKENDDLINTYIELLQMKDEQA